MNKTENNENEQFQPESLYGENIIDNPRSWIAWKREAERLRAALQEIWNIDYEIIMNWQHWNQVYQIADRALESATSDKDAA